VIEETLPAGLEPFLFADGKVFIGLNILGGGMEIPQFGHELRLGPLRMGGAFEDGVGTPRKNCRQGKYAPGVLHIPHDQFLTSSAKRSLA
jgi:hypothetical protein